MESTWYNPGEIVATVNPADIKALWQIRREAEARNPGQQVAIGGLDRTCSAGADVYSTGYRATILALLYHAVEQRPEESEAQTLAKWKHGDELDDAIFRVMATIPIRWIPKDGMQGLPFDGGDFIKRVEQEAA
jgi:hypothetical protein